MSRYFIDCEFNGFGGDLISLALVHEDGKSLCLEYPLRKDIHPWVAENVIPHLRAGREPVREVDHLEGARALHAFLRLDPQPIILADWPDDIAYFCKALITGPGEMVALGNLVFQILRVPSYPCDLDGVVQHCAWWDAMALRYALTGKRP